MTKLGKVFLTILVLLGIITILSFKVVNKSADERNCKSALVESYTEQSGMLQEIDSLKTTLSGLQETGTEELTGTTPEEVSAILYYPNQPEQAIGTYEGNTQALNLYSSKTSQSAIISQDFKGEIIVKLRKTPTIHTVVYFKTNRIYCGGRLNEPINDNNEFILSMDGFKVGKNNCVLRNTDGTLPEEIRVGGYVANFEGNGIETVTFK